MKAEIAEIFSSIQGEGIYAGEPQIFLRFVSCNMSCSFCDEKSKKPRSAMTPEEAIKKINSLEKRFGPHHSVSLTGGEPLLQYGFLKDFLPLLKKGKYPVYLETNGTLCENFKKLIRFFDIIAMDMKLPSSTGDRACWREHEKFLAAAGGKRVFVKAVVSKNTAENEFMRGVRLIASRKRSIPLVIQPVTRGKKIYCGEKIFEFQRAAKKYLDDVRTIPQIHKIMEVR